MDNSLTFIDIGLYIAYVLIFITLLGAVLFPLIHTFSDFKKAKSGLIGFLLLVVILVAAYLISPADQGLIYEKHDIGPKLSKAIGAGLFTTYFVLIFSALAIVYTEVVKIVK